MNNFTQQSGILKIAITQIFLLFQFNIVAQDVQSEVRISQKAGIMQTIGTTEINVEYSSPKVRNRKIFGGIVPVNFNYEGNELAWRAGSNARTRFKTNEPVLIGGKELPAGDYGLVILVHEKEWTIVFSKEHTWGAFQYSKENDVLRVNVPVEKTNFQEWLSYQFIQPEATSVGLELHWDRSRAVLPIEVDVENNVISALKAKSDKTAADYHSLAAWAINSKSISNREVLEFIETGINMIDSMEHDYEKDAYGFALKMLKADVLEKEGRTKEAKQLKEATLPTAKGFNLYYYALNKYIHSGEKEVAYAILEDWIQKEPSQWTAHLAIGEYYLKEKNLKKAVASFENAYKYSPENWKHYSRYLWLQNKWAMDHGVDIWNNISEDY